MTNDILLHVHDAEQLERLYQTDKAGFKRSFDVLYPDLEDRSLARFWYARLHYSSEAAGWGSGKDLLFIAGAILLAGLLARLPFLAGMSEDVYYQRNIGFIIFPVLTAWFAWKRQLSIGKIALLAGAAILSAVFINWLPNEHTNDTTELSCIHLFLFLYAITGIAYVGNKASDQEGRLSYLRYNGDLLVMCALMVIAGGILSGMTIGLFHLIGYDIERFYRENVIVLGLPAVPIVATWLTQNNPQLVGKVSPVIARIFSPLVLVMLVVYLSTILFSGKDLFNDRNFLLFFNVVLIGVMALIFFSVAETTKKVSWKAEAWILWLLSLVTLIVNGIALSAILFRISAWGITPNRIAVLGGNVLMLVHLCLVALRLYQVVVKKKGIATVGYAIAQYLPVYVVWTIIVTFLFPFIFNFR